MFNMMTVDYFAIKKFYYSQLQNFQKVVYLINASSIYLTVS